MTEKAISPKVSIIIVSYNTREMTLEAIGSARKQTRILHEIIVVDNASSDGSAEAIGNAFPDIRLLAEASNHGFAKANNIAAELATGEYLLLLNPDTITLDGAIDKLVAFAELTPEAGIWGGRTLFADRSLNPTSCWGDMTVWSLFCRAIGLSPLLSGSEFFNPESYGNWARDRERQIDIVSGCFFLIKREFWQRLGGFDLRYVMYGEETDLCLRARKIGARPRFTPDAEIVHYVGAASSVRADRQVMVLKAKSTLIRRHFRPLSKPFGLILLWIWAAGRGVWARIKGAKGQDSRLPPWAEVLSRRREWFPGYPIT